MKRKDGLLKAVAGSLFAALLLTSCGEIAMDFPKQEATAKSVESVAESIADETASKDDSEQNVVREEDIAKFKEAFEKNRAITSISPASNDTQVIVNDYDGDGKLEAFAFDGISVDYFPDAPSWESASLYYLDSDYNLTPILGGDSGNDVINGRPLGLKDTTQEALQACGFQDGNDRYLVWDGCYWEGGWFSIVMGVRDGEAKISMTDRNFTRNEDGSFVAMGDDGIESHYLMQADGTFIKDGSTQQKIQESQNDGQGLSDELLKQIWEEEKEYYIEWGDFGVPESELKYYFLPADYDGDGKREAYAILGKFDASGHGECVTIYLINSEGQVKSITENADLFMLSDNLNGKFLKASAPTGEDQSSMLIDTGDRKFLAWEVDFYDTAYSMLLSVKNGDVFESAQSWNYRNFQKNSDGTYTADFQGTSDPTIYKVKFAYNPTERDFDALPE